MSGWPLLSIVIFLPLVGVAFILAVRGDNAPAVDNIRRVALITTSFNFLISLALWGAFDTAEPSFQFVEKREWVTGVVSYHFGVDGISMPLVLLTTFLMPFCVLASWRTITTRVREFMVAFLVLETLILGVFCALDTVLFFVFMQALLVPMFLIIGIWGGPKRIEAAFKYFFYGFAASLLTLLAIVEMAWESGSTQIPDLLAYDFPPEVQVWIWFALLAAFAINVPIWPFHTWLPQTHAEAPTAGSVILGGVVLKIGTYGFLRFSVPMLPEASAEYSWLIFMLSALAILSASLAALVQTDMKRLVAYGAIAQMGFVAIGIFSMNTQGVQGAAFTMVFHGIVAAGLFLCVGMLADRANTREISAFGGLKSRMPLFAAALFIMTIAAIGVPGTTGFVGEFLTLLGAYKVSTVAGTAAALGVVLAAAYGLRLYRRLILGPLDKESMKRMVDLTRRERAVLAPLVALTIVFGVYPNPILSVSDATVNALVTNVSDAGQRQVRPAVDGSAFAPAGASAADAVRAGLEAITPPAEGAPRPPAAQSDAAAPGGEPTAGAGSAGGNDGG